VFVFIIIYVGLTAILSQVIGVVDVLKIISYGIAAAMALIIIPVVFYMVRVALKEASQVESE
ncbi:MAG: hypothetical protein LM558_04065, partial [Thermosphaera sp.]|nr:hypothetical protein [Thermosphaera sp.]